MNTWQQAVAESTFSFVAAPCAWPVNQPHAPTPTHHARGGVDQAKHDRLDHASAFELLLMPLGAGFEPCQQRRLQVARAPALLLWRGGAGARRGKRRARGGAVHHIAHWRQPEGPTHPAVAVSGIQRGPDGIPRSATCC